jgi:hypothetical protein
MTASRDLLDLLLRHVPAATMDAAVRDRAITAMARRLGIAAGEEDIQAAADQFRAERELLTYEATRRWLSRHWLSAENWHKLLEARVEARRLLDSPAIAAQVQESFEARAAEYARALVARLVVEDEGLAHELFLLVREGAHDFEVLARRYSLEPVRAGPGMPYLARRWRFRYELPPAVAERAFGVPVSEPILHPPLEIEGAWHLYRIDATQAATLDDETRLAVSLRILDAEVAPFIVAAEAELRAQLGTDENTG